MGGWGLGCGVWRGAWWVCDVCEHTCGGCVLGMCYTVLIACREGGVFQWGWGRADFGITLQSVCWKLELKLACL